MQADKRIGTKVVHPSDNPPGVPLITYQNPVPTLMVNPNSIVPVPPDATLPAHPNSTLLIHPTVALLAPLLLPYQCPIHSLVFRAVTF